jgi:ATP-binding cassette subfamily F protein 3
MRVALAVLFAQPDLLLLDEPTNYLDLEGTLWLVDYLSRRPASRHRHDRDLLDDVATHGHLERKLTLYKGGLLLRKTATRGRSSHKRRQKQKSSASIRAFIDRFRSRRRRRARRDR